MLEKIIFPDARTATVEGLVAVGGNLGVETLVAAYENGIFPWPQEGMPMLWFSPEPRGVLDFAEAAMPDSFRKWFAKQDLRFSINEAFETVIEQCRRQPRPGQSGTWILAEMIPAYTHLQQRGGALSLECWDGDELIGGIYGVLSKRYFSAESMFYKKPNASKACLWKLIEHLREKKFTWMDIQMVTPVSEQFGGKYISREEFLKRIGK